MDISCRTNVNVIFLYSVDGNLMYYALIIYWWLTGNSETIMYFVEYEHCVIAQEVYSRGLSPTSELTVMCVIRKEM